MRVSGPVAPRLVSMGREREREKNGQCVTSRMVPCKMNNERVTHSIGCNPRLHTFRRFVDGLNIENVADRPRCRKLAATTFRL